MWCDHKSAICTLTRNGGTGLKSLVPSWVTTKAKPVLIDIREEYFNGSETQEKKASARRANPAAAVADEAATAGAAKPKKAAKKRVAKKAGAAKKAGTAKKATGRKPAAKKAGAAKKATAKKTTAKTCS